LVAVPTLGVGGDRSGHQAAADDGRRRPHAGHGAERGPPGGPGAGARLLPLFLTDGFKADPTALLTPYGQWVQPARQRAQGPAPKPRWMPLPQLLYAQVVKTVRRRRLAQVHHRVVFGTLEAVNAVLAPLGCQINTAFIERLNLSMRQH